MPFPLNIEIMHNLMQQMIIGPYSWSPEAILGKGSTGTVYKGLKEGTIPVAIKAIKLSTINDQVTRSLFENEKKALKMTTSANIVKLYDIIEEGGYCYIVTEECAGGSLKNYIARRGALQDSEALNLLRGILTGCYALSRQLIIHRDLKPANIMLRANGEPVIIDLGYCEIISQKIMKAFNVGSPSYMAPEAYLRTMYSEKSDSWSVGISFYEMLTGKTLDAGIPVRQYFDKVNQNIHLPNLSGFSQTSREIIEKTLVTNAQQRLSLAQMKYIVDLDFFNRKKNIGNMLTPKTSVKETVFHSKTPQRSIQSEVNEYGVRSNGSSHLNVQLGNENSIMSFSAESKNGSSQLIYIQSHRAIPQDPYAQHQGPGNPHNVTQKFPSAELIPSNRLIQEVSYKQQSNIRKPGLTENCAYYHPTSMKIHEKQAFLKQIQQNMEGSQREDQVRIRRLHEQIQRKFNTEYMEVKAQIPRQPSIHPSIHPSNQLRRYSGTNVDNTLNCQDIRATQGEQRMVTPFSLENSSSSQTRFQRIRNV